MTPADELRDAADRGCVVSTAWVRFTHRFRGYYVQPYTCLKPVLDVLEYRADGRVLIVGPGGCPLWFDRDRLVVRPGVTS